MAVKHPFNIKPTSGGKSVINRPKNQMDSLLDSEWMPIIIRKWMAKKSVFFLQLVGGFASKKHEKRLFFANSTPFLHIKLAMRMPHISIR